MTSAASLVSLVMTDIVESTRRWNTDAEAMAADLALHDQIVRQVVEAVDGTVFKHTGDGLIATFDDPVAAASAAAGVQRRIGATSWQHPDGLRVRAAVHTGMVYPRDGDLFGTAVNRVARLLGTCPPGAVVVSGAAAVLLDERAPEGLGLAPVGSVQLAGFAVPDEVHALVGPGLADVSDTFAAAPRDRARLPSIDDELVGRSSELASIWEAMGRSRLVTLVGVGGMGKTRLALEVAAGAATAFAGEIWWVDLGAATSDSAVPAVAMAAVGARESPGRTPLDSFADRFAGVAGVIVIDNCEHVLRSVRPLVETLRGAAPEMRIVATSREALGLRGEHLVAVGSLEPDDGVGLFAVRAKAVRPDLDLDGDIDAVRRICRRLDGIPLAIELAAARCRSLTPTEIDARLDDRFRLLRGGRVGVERHRTLQAAVGWSYSLLDDDERTVFDQMAVFAGGSLIDGLTAVTGLDGFDVVDIVDRLIARSMVVATRTPLGTRYHQLETLRQFAEDRLAEAGTAADVRERHLDWARGLTGWISSCTGTPRAGDSCRRFGLEIDNLRVAVGHAVSTGRHHVAQQIVADVALYAVDKPAWEVFDWVRPIDLTDGWTHAAAVCATMGHHADEQRHGLLGFSRSNGGVPDEFLMSNWTIAVISMGHAASNGAWREALAIADEFEPPHDAARCWLTSMKMWATGIGMNNGGVSESEFDQALELARKDLDLARSLGDDYVIAVSSIFTAYVVLERDPRAAVGLCLEAIDSLESLGAAYQVARAQTILSIAQCTAVEAGELPLIGIARSVRDQILDALEYHRRFVASTFVRAATRLLARPEPEVAALAAFAIRQRSGLPVWWRIAARLHEDPDFDEAALVARAATLSTDDVMRIVLEALDRVISAGGPD